MAWRLCTSMSANDVADTLDNALCFTELGRVKVRHKPRLSSNNSPGYLVGELADYLQENGMTHAWGSAYQPRPQSKIERWHQSIKNQILLNNYYLPSELHEHLQRFISY